MREILFRGKSETGFWIEGFLFQTECDGVKEWCISKTPLSANDYSEILGDYAEVIPESVSEFTGLTDKNGKKVFEGDLLLSNGSLVWLVSFENGAFVCKDECLKTYFNFYEHSDYDTKTGTFNSYISKYEVIGNIHDNPELLKGGER